MRRVLPRDSLFSVSDSLITPSADAVGEIDVDSDRASPASGAESARRAIAVLVAFADHPVMSARDVANVTSIPLPSVYRYLALLRECRLLLSDDRGVHRLSPRVFALSHAAEKADSLVEIARPVMFQLLAECHETVQLMRLVGKSVLCVYRVESPHNLRISSEPGHPLPAGRGASGRLLLASLPSDARRHYLAEVAQKDKRGVAFTEEDIVEADVRGWATSEEEIDEGIWAAAAAVKKGLTTVATITVLCPLVRAPAELREELLGRVRGAASEINLMLNG
jgi:DNA-binding IclR family transcriptional regulator